MFPLSQIGPFDHTEKKALLVAAFCCALFIVFFSASMTVKRVRVQKKWTIVSTTPPTKPYEPSEPSYGDPLERFRVVPRNFSDVDFQNFSYGTYPSSDLKPLNLTLTGGNMWDESGWFNVQDVYYNDITGDGSPEAIVRLLHLRCHGSCDGGADLFYIYTRRNGKLRNIWRYETGSYAYGCGLKAFTVENKQMVLELFGRCARPAMDYPGPSKFMVEDLTAILFRFEGGRFVTKTIQYIPEPSRSVKHWQPEIRIY
ncbi:MAG TPA: hypothetical protein VKB05_04135 [Pyrinomonadaceae bacterium]|nr:hypothetical protein [Pyrinomonadaceae bacterium]